MLLSLLLSTPAMAAELEPYALGQVWVTLYDMDRAEQADPAGYGDPEDDPGFKLRRARLGATRAAEFGGTPQERVGMSMIFGMSAGADPIISPNPGQLGLIDAHMSFAATENLTLATGLVKVPWGRENQLSSSSLAFQDRTVQSNHLVSLREVGAVASWKHSSGLHLQGGVFNGNGSLVGDQDALFLFAGRAQWDSASSDGASSLISVGTDVAYNLQAATNSLVLGGDLLLSVKSFELMAEGHWAQITPVAGSVELPGVLAQTTRIGAYAQAGYTVAERWQPVVRWETFDQNTGISDNGDLMHVYAGVNSTWLEDTLSLGVGYVLRMETGGAALPNDTTRLWMQYRY